MRKQVLLTILISTSFLAQAAIPTGYYHFALERKSGTEKQRCMKFQRRSQYLITAVNRLYMAGFLCHRPQCG